MGVSQLEDAYGPTQSSRQLQCLLGERKASPCLSPSQASPCRNTDPTRPLLQPLQILHIDGFKIPELLAQLPNGQLPGKRAHPPLYLALKQMKLWPLEGSESVLWALREAACVVYLGEWPCPQIPRLGAEAPAPPVILDFSGENTPQDKKPHSLIFSHD